MRRVGTDARPEAESATAVFVWRGRSIRACVFASFPLGAGRARRINAGLCVPELSMMTCTSNSAGPWTSRRSRRRDTRSRDAADDSDPARVPYFTARAAKSAVGPCRCVVVGPPVSVARAQGEHRRRAIPGLDLRRVVDAEDRGVRRRIEIHPHDVADRVDAQRIRRPREGLRAMRLPSESLPDAMHTHRTSLVSPTWLVLLRRTVTRMPSASPAPATSAHRRAATRGAATEGVTG